MGEQASLSFTRDGAVSGSLLACKRKHHTQREKGEEGIKPRKGELRLSPHPCCCKGLPIPLLLPLRSFSLKYSIFSSPRSEALPSTQLPHSPSAPTTKSPLHQPLLHIPFLHPLVPCTAGCPLLAFVQGKIKLPLQLQTKGPLSE